MIYLTESIDVQPGDLDALLAGFENHYLPGARDRGMEFVACWHTPINIGEDVTVTVIFGIESWARWETIRNAAVSDPEVATWVELRRSLMLRGRRTFSEPASFSPR
jgi:hypothetical protein